MARTATAADRSREAAIAAAYEQAYYAQVRAEVKEQMIADPFFLPDDWEEQEMVDRINAEGRYWCSRGVHTMRDESPEAECAFCGYRDEF